MKKNKQTIETSYDLYTCICRPIYTLPIHKCATVTDSQGKYKSVDVAEFYSRHSLTILYNA